MEKKYIDKEFDRFLAANPKIYAALKNPKAPKPTPPKKLTAPEKKYKDQFKMANTAMKNMSELMKTPLIEIGNRKFTMDEQGAFVDIINEYRKEAEGKVQTMEKMKADYILEEGEAAWIENYGNVDLNTVGYVKKSGKTKEIIDLNIGTYNQKIETFVDLIYPGLSKTERDKMKKGLKGNEGEITLNKSELP